MAGGDTRQGGSAEEDNELLCIPFAVIEVPANNLS
jgi:hypothetical protein